MPNQAIQTEEAQKLLAQALRAAAGTDGAFPAFWKRLDAEAKEYVADTLAKTLVAQVGVAAEQRGQSAAAALDALTSRIAHGGLDVRRGKHAAPDTAKEG